MGLLWLSTVPPTNALVAIMFGTRYLGMLGGLVFFSHQIGSFLGVWLGGYLYDQFGSYNPVWWLGVALGIFAAIVHWPIREQPVARPQMIPADRAVQATRSTRPSLSKLPRSAPMSRWIVVTEISGKASTKSSMIVNSSVGSSAGSRHPGRTG
jgi:MFS family permease